MPPVLPSPREVLSELRAPIRQHRIRSADHIRVMQAMKDRQAIFVHVPKTGGKSISSELYGTELHEGFGHATALFYQELFGAISYKKFFSFGFVRNPWDRAYSAYRFARAGGFGFKKGLELQQSIGNRDFNTFVREWLAVEDISRYVIFRPQCDFICDRSDSVLVERVCRFERFDEEYAFLRQHLRLGRAPKHINSSESGPGYREIYDADARAIIRRLYARDIAAFGYAFGPD